jgi:hypothetical protein
MRKIIALSLIVLLSSSIAHAGSSRVRPHVRKDGTFVQPHRRTNPDSSKFNNFSTKGNVNPFTGKEGTVDPFKPTPKRRSR